MAKFQTWHVWIEYKEDPDDTSTCWEKVEVEAPNNFEASRLAAQKFWDGYKRNPIKAMSYDVGFGTGVNPIKFKSKVIYEVDRDTEATHLL